MTRTARQAPGSSPREHVERRSPDGREGDFTLLGPDGRPYASSVPGRLGGYRPRRIYGRLDCPSALRHLAAGRYAEHRVFFATQEDAVAAGFRPRAVCMPEAFAARRGTIGATALTASRQS